MNRSFSVSVLATFITLGTQSAFAETAVTDAAPAAVRLASAATVSIASPAHRPAVQIPGTFALSGIDASRDDVALGDQVRALLTPLSGDGGG